MVVKDFSVAGVRVLWYANEPEHLSVELHADSVELDAEELDAVIDVLRAAYYEVKEAAGKSA